MLERRALAEFGRAVRAAGAMYIRILDPTPEELTRPGRRSLSQRPYDAEVLWAGKFAAIEAKVVKPGGYLTLAPHQIDNLARVSTFGHAAWILVRRERSERGEAELFVIPIDAYARYLTETHRKGVPHRAIPGLGHAIPRARGAYRLTGAVWDVRPLLGIAPYVRQTTLEEKG